MKKGSAGKAALIGVLFLALTFIWYLIEQGMGPPTTQLGAILPGMIGSFLTVGTIILFILAIIQAIRNRKANK